MKEIKNDKVGILTFHRSINYGSALQAWALYTVVSQMKFEVEIIDYYPNNYSEVYADFWKPINKKNIISDIFHILLRNYFKKRKSDFNLFLDKNVELSPKSVSPGHEIKPYINRKNVMICGSDQIWNILALDYDEMYTLPDATCKKIAYAVSMGKSYKTKNEKMEALISNVSAFNSISTREIESANLLRETTGKNIEVTLDPTLLLSQDRYRAIMSDKSISGHYIFLYSVKLNPSVVRTAKKLSKLLNLPVYTLLAGRGNAKYIFESAWLKIPKEDVGPSGFLKYISEADYVITDSFHGTVFSIIFKKNFWSINSNCHNSYRNDERILGLLKLLNLQERYITEDDFDKTDYKKQIDYIQADAKLTKYINHSYRFLNEALHI